MFITLITNIMKKGCILNYALNEAVKYVVRAYIACLKRKGSLPEPFLLKNNV